MSKDAAQAEITVGRVSIGAYVDEHQAQTFAYARDLDRRSISEALRAAIDLYVEHVAQTVGRPLIEGLSADLAELDRLRAEGAARREATHEN